MATEDFTTYTETDADADITVTAGKIAVSTMQKQAVSYVYKDKGAAHFAGDFTHQLDLIVTAGQNLSKHYVWSLANAVGAFQALIDASGDAQSVQAFAFSSNYAIYCTDLDGGTHNVSAGSTALSYSTQYYLEVERDEAASTFGDLICRIYSDASRTTLVDTVTLSLATSKKDFRYVYGVQSAADTASGTKTMTFDIENLDLQEGGVAAGTDQVDRHVPRGLARGLVRGVA